MRIPALLPLPFDFFDLLAVFFAKAEQVASSGEDDLRVTILRHRPEPAKKTNSPEIVREFRLHQVSKRHREASTLPRRGKDLPWSRTQYKGRREMLMLSFPSSFRYGKSDDFDRRQGAHRCREIQMQDLGMTFESKTELQAHNKTHGGKR
jgi:hypothetical protein